MAKKYLAESGVNWLISKIKTELAPMVHHHDERYYTKEQTLSAQTAALFGGVSTPDEAFARLAAAVWPDQGPVYTALELGELTEGDVILIPENGTQVEFEIAKFGYQQDINSAANRVLMVRKNCYGERRKWNDTAVNTYINSTVHEWLNSTYKSMFGADIQSAMDTTGFWYTPGSQSNRLTGGFASVFLLSATELGLSDACAFVEGEPLPNAAKLQHADNYHLTRSPYSDNSTDIWSVYPYGGLMKIPCTDPFYVRPAFTLPDDLTVYRDGSGKLCTHPTYDRLALVDMNGNKLPDLTDAVSK